LLLLSRFLPSKTTCANSSSLSMIESGESFELSSGADDIKRRVLLVLFKYVLWKSVQARKVDGKKINL
jgi:hypothetical protein